MSDHPSSETQNRLDGHDFNHANISDGVYEFLRRRILDHEYPPGYRFDLSGLADELGISRTPIREAMHRLEAEGLVDILPRRGTFVTTIELQEIAEGFDVRCALERFAAEIAACAATDEEIAHLRAILSEMRQLLAVVDYQSVVQKYIALDHEFHVGVVTLARNRRLTEIYKTVGGPLQIARILRQFSADGSKTYTEPEHEAIMQALERRDAQALVKALSDHVERARARILKALSERSETSTK